MAARDEFESATENTELASLLRRRIDAEGAITFHDFMETALYHPALGYYASRQPMGREGDYLTSPEVSSIFGAVAGRQLEQLWQAMGRPQRFEVVEQGAGTGRMARDIVRWAAQRELGPALRYRIVEISAELRRRQEETLAGVSGVVWLDALPDAIDGVVLTNELLDSFPVHRVVRRETGLQELYVANSEGQFDWQAGPLSTPRIAEYFDALGLLPGVDCAAEVNLHALDWMKDVSSRLRRGFVLTFDYGYPAPELYAPWRKDGTLLCFYHHNASGDAFARVGKQDMTSHVDFTTLIRTGAEHGLKVAGFTTQSRFLANLGAGDAIGAVARESPDALEEYYARRRAVQELIDPAGLGRVRVLLQRKGVEAAELPGFRDE
ncbi:MAG: SAM-dependent methyltransferase [Dehalococcoidia bacterium]